MPDSKLIFLLEKYPSLLKNLDPSTQAQWGKMNVQQMIEHMTDSVREANGKIPRTIVTPAENLSKMKDFLLSEKEFRPNTKNVLMGEEPMPVRNASIKDSIVALENEIQDFVKHYEGRQELLVTNPFFGNLNFNEWIQLLHKHAVHHLKQFGVVF